MNNAHALCIGAAMTMGASASQVFAGGCTWNNGGWDGVDAQTSEVGTAVDETRTADDFCLKEGYVYEINFIRVFMLTSSEEVDATLQLYHDCDGCPGEVVDCGFFEDFRVASRTNNVSGDLDLVELLFDTGPRTVTDEYGNEEDLPGLWLKGGCYWVSPVWQGDGSGYDRGLWGTADGDVIGAIPKTQIGPYKFKGWVPVDGLNVECRNFAFEVIADACCILQDNGPPADDVAGAVNTTGVGCANADDFVLPRCSDAQEICFFSTYVWTNCDCTRTKLEVLVDDCGVPTDQPFGTRSGTAQYLADKCIDMKRTVTFDGQQLSLYRVEWHNPGISLTQAPACNGWVSVHVQGTGSLAERGIVAFADRCGTECDGSFSPGHAICPPDQIIDWESVGRDYSFCLATRSITQTEAEAAPACAADYNADGAATITDMLGFLEVWMRGCDE